MPKCNIRRLSECFIISLGYWKSIAERAEKKTGRKMDPVAWDPGTGAGNGIGHMKRLGEGVSV